MNNIGQPTTGHRSSRQRRLILEELRRHPCHPTADQLYVRVREHLPHVSLATVYRNLELLAAMGTIQRLDHCGDQRHYDGETAEHSHVTCTRCGVVADLPMGPLPGIRAAVQAMTDYRVLQVGLICQGLCKACAAATSKGDATEQ